MKDYTLVYCFSYRLMVSLFKSRSHFNPYLADKWTVPGGKVEPGEEPVHCAEREFLEEAGLDLSGRLLHVLSMPCNCLPQKEAEHMLHVFTCSLPNDQIMKARSMEKEFVTLTDWTTLNFSDWVRYSRSLVDLSQIRLEQAERSRT